MSSLQRSVSSPESASVVSPRNHSQPRDLETRDFGERNRKRAQGHDRAGGTSVRKNHRHDVGSRKSRFKTIPGKSVSTYDLDTLRLEMKAFPGRFHAGFLGSPNPEKGAPLFLIAEIAQPAEFRLAKTSPTETVNIDPAIKTLEVYADRWQAGDRERRTTFGMREVEMKRFPRQEGLAPLTGFKDHPVGSDPEMPGEKSPQHGPTTGETIAMNREDKSVGPVPLLLIEPLSRQIEGKDRLVIEGERSHFYLMGTRTQHDGVDSKPNRST